MTRSLSLLALTIFASSLPVAAQSAPDPYRQIRDEAGRPRVLLIGDSISVGYTEPVRQLLAGKYTVHRIPENGGTTANGVAKIEKWLGEGPWSVIHFNFGLHDLRIMETGKHQVALDDYESNLRKLVARLKQTGARLIWAATTPVPDAKVSPPRVSSDVIEYNAAAKRVMEENGVPIDDLYSLALPQLAKIQRPANVHFTPEGSEVLARQVAYWIEKR